jgi:hypothetical protein
LYFTWNFFLALVVLAGVAINSDQRQFNSSTINVIFRVCTFDNVVNTNPSERHTSVFICPPFLPSFRCLFGRNCFRMDSSFFFSFFNPMTDDDKRHLFSRVVRAAATETYFLHHPPPPPGLCLFLKRPRAALISTMQSGN